MGRPRVARGSPRDLSAVPSWVAQRVAHGSPRWVEKWVVHGTPVGRPPVTCVSPMGRPPVACKSPMDRRWAVYALLMCHLRINCHQLSHGSDTDRPWLELVCRLWYPMSRLWASQGCPSVGPYLKVRYKCLTPGEGRHAGFK